jgi:hypothetical protein
MSRPYAWRPQACLKITAFSTVKSLSVRIGKHNIALHCTAMLWAISMLTSTISARQIGTIVLVPLTRLFGADEDSDTFSTSMVPKSLLLLCVAQTNAQPVSRGEQVLDIHPQNAEAAERQAAIPLKSPGLPMMGADYAAAMVRLPSWSRTSSALCIPFFAGHPRSLLSG